MHKVAVIWKYSLMSLILYNLLFEMPPMSFEMSATLGNAYDSCILMTE